ncbi:uncharacterized protein A4U43_C04F530 [Asparagus officinalis]|uniref:Uncharacterized protein n=1 Tax=Asparagus officinalis TaxID=4686 RepID=A0A5P1EXP8_ASPOF|nr:uncharacterized protein A4U43_C04F530 [Asparagus officinalis]
MEEEDERQFQCLRKYEVIAKQSSRAAGTSSGSQRTRADEVLVETITKFLRELDAEKETETNVNESNK